MNEISGTKTARRFGFGWLGAISFGGVLSFVLFLVGASNFDELMVKLGLRSVVHTEQSRTYAFGDVIVSVQQTHVENLGRNGVAYRSVAEVSVDGVPRRKSEDGAFVQENGSNVTFGTARQAWVSAPPFSTARAVAFCNVTARYKFGIPVYHYNTGIQYRATGLTDMTAVDRADPMFAVAQRAAEAEGVADTTNARIGADGATDFLEEGLTMRWGFCDDYELPKL